MEPIKVGKYNDVIYWNEYQGNYSITLGWVNQAGEPKPTMCTRELGKEKKATRMSVSIPMGSKEEAIGNMLILLDGLGYKVEGGKKQESGGYDAPDGDDDVPF